MRASRNQLKPDTQPDAFVLFYQVVHGGLTPSEALRAANNPCSKQNLCKRLAFLKERTAQSLKKKRKAEDALIVDC